jgi:DNA-binding PadR family transcriptional regulator
LVREVSARTGGLVELDPGNLYRVIKRLVDADLVAEAAHRAAPDLGRGDVRGRDYRLTARGGGVLSAELQRLLALVNSPATRALVRRLAT